MIQRTLELGPIHHILPGAMKLGLGLEGDVIKTCDIELGYQSKKIKERVAEKPLALVQDFITHLEPEQAPILDLLFSRCIEDALEHPLNEKINWIREIMTGLSDLSILLLYLAENTKALENAITKNIILKHRENLLDLIELLTGSRYGYGYIIPGGLRYDLSEGFHERLAGWIQEVLEDQSRIEAFLFWSPQTKEMLKKTGLITHISERGFLQNSATQVSDYGHISSVYSRIYYAHSIFFELVNKLQNHLNNSLLDRPDAFFFDPKIQHSFQVGSKTQQYFESVRGSWRMNFQINEKNQIESFTCITPSHAIQPYLGASLENENIDSIEIILKSLFFRICEVDQ